MTEYHIEIRNAKTGELLRTFGATMALSLDEAKRIADRAMTNPGLIRAGLAYVVAKKPT